MKRIGVRCLLFLFIPLITGCWDSEDIENRANVLAIAIDEVDSNTEEEEDNITHLGDTPQTEMIRVTVQIAVPGEVPLGPPMGGESESEPVWVLSTIGHTLEEAISNLQQEIAEQLFLGQIRVIVLNEDVAKKGVDRFNESLRRNPEIRRSAWMVVSAEEAAQYMDIAPELEQVPTIYLSNMIENAVGLGKFPEDYMGLFWRRTSSKGQDGYLPYLKVMTSDNIQMNGLAYFKGDQMVDSTEPVDIGTFMGIIGFQKGGYDYFDSVPGTDAHVLTEAIQRQSKINTEMKEGEPRLSVTMRYEFDIIEKTDDDVDLSDPQVIKRIETKGREGLIDNAEQFISQMQEEQSDIFGFGEYIRAKHPGYWKREIGTKENWHEHFQDLDVDVDAKYNIRRVDTQAR
ncbi:Ger(x)C family spore germination protein [Salicibibacter cibarius]|uniref:Ger(X)C family spore germination protein n=1 Tax=Salicibibacter cibarius TaxID=2743000 RepID=A0A7T7CDF2_9BACI|nr:Ger(x)C family spore germination protein [Salicibibacter cibarius]QQK77959.1 Ger(x)C family spore germination protein [Salicibibacter cibarius]